MEPILAALGTNAVVEGVKFLYQQAGEILGAWRKRRQDMAAPPPRMLEPPQEVSVGPVSFVESPSPALQDQLMELKDMAEQIKEGQIDPNSQDARTILGSLRDVMEVILRAPITFTGESPRALRIQDVDVTVQNVWDQVAGVRASLEKLKGATEIREVKVNAGDVQPGGHVTGIDLI